MSRGLLVPLAICAGHAPAAWAGPGVRVADTVGRAWANEPIAWAVTFGPGECRDPMIHGSPKQFGVGATAHRGAGRLMNRERQCSREYSGS